MERKENKKYTGLGVFDTELKCLQLGLFYPSLDGRYFLLNSLIGIFILLYCLAGLMSMLILVYLERTNLTKVSETFLFCMTHFAYLCKFTNFVLNLKNMKTVQRFLEKPILNQLTEEHQEIMDGYMVPFNKFVLIFRILIVLSIIFYGLFPYMDNNANNLISLPGWFPFSVEKYRLEIILGQVFLICVSAFNNSTLDITMSKLMTYGSAQFDILKSIIMEVFKDDDPENEVIRNELIQSRIKKIVEYHITILDYVAAVEKVFTVGTFIQFLSSGIIICLTGFQMVVISPKSFMFFMLTFYLLTVTCEVALYCWYGNELIFSSIELPEACYMSNWVGCNASVGNSLRIIMEKGKVPVSVSAGKFFSLSLATLMAILRTSYSYFAVLQRVYSKDE